MEVSWGIGTAAITTHEQEGAAAWRTDLFGEIRAAVDLLAKALGPLELLGVAEEIRSLQEGLSALVGQGEIVIELAGWGRPELEALLGEAMLVPVLAKDVTVCLRRAAELGYEARWSDDRRERSPREESAFLATAVAKVERAIRDATEQTRPLTQDAAIPAEHRSDPFVAPTGKAATVEPKRPFRPSALYGWIARLWRARGDRAVTPPEALAGDAQEALDSLRARLVTLEAARQERLAELAAHRADAHYRLVARIRALSAGAEGPLELEIGAPAVPGGMRLLLGPVTSPTGTTPPHATLILSSGLQPPLPPDRPAIIVAQGAERAELLAHLERLGRDVLAAIARQVSAALCLCRNHILDLDRHCRRVSQAAIGELDTRRVPEPQARRQAEGAAAQEAVARQAVQIVEEGRSQLTHLLAEVRTAWAERIESCSGMEQLNAEVGAIENGAAHRLSLVIDDLREALTLRCVRVVLELARPVRQELLTKRLEVAGGRPHDTEKNFDAIRIALPRAIEAMFASMRTPSVRKLAAERGLFGSLLRTLSREKRACAERVAVQMDEIERSLGEGLSSAGVLLVPLLSSTLGDVLDELLVAHQRWIEARKAEQAIAYTKELARNAPAQELVQPLEQQEHALRRLLET